MSLESLLGKFFVFMPLSFIPLASVLLQVPMNADGSLNIFEIASKLSPSVILVYVAWDLNKKLEAREKYARDEEKEIRLEMKEIHKEFTLALKEQRDFYEKIYEKLEKK